jgi:hypothetical protein
MRINYKNKLTTVAGIFLVLLTHSFGVIAQVPTQKEAKGDPLFFIDGKEMIKSEMSKVNSEEIGRVTVLKNKSGKYGEKGKYGVVLIETKTYCRGLFQQYFSSKSPEYKKILGSPVNDQEFQYILDEKVLTKNYEGDLAGIVDSSFLSINVLSGDALKAYGVSGPRYGILIKTKLKEKAKVALPKSKFEPELLILSPGKTSFDPSAAKAIEGINKKFKTKQPGEEAEQSEVTEENGRLMMESAMAYSGKLNFFNQTSKMAQGYLVYRFMERFPNTLILVKDIRGPEGLNALAKLAEDEKMPYVLSFPSMHVAKEKGQFVLHLKVQLYEMESNSLLLDKEYIGDQRNQGFEFSCDGSINCTINNALSEALVDVVREIASNNKTLKAEQILKEKRYSVIEADLLPKTLDASLIEKIIPKSDSTIQLNSLYQTLYNGDQTKFVGFLYCKVDKQNFKSLAESRKDKQVKILSGGNIKDEGFLDNIPQSYSYIVKGVFSNGRWYYKKDKVTYFEAENEKEGKLKYLNNLQSWGYFKDKLTEISPDFWEGELFEKIPDRRKDPNWEKYQDMWETQERENRNYIGMYELIAEQLKEEKTISENTFKDSVFNQVFKPFYDAKGKSGEDQILGYKSSSKDFLLIYNSDKKAILNPIEIKDEKGVVKVRYFVFLPVSEEIYEWSYFPASISKKGSVNNSIMKNLATITKWDYSYDTLDDEQFWNNYVLLKENGAYRYLKRLK